MTIFRLFRENRPLLFFTVISLVLATIAIGLFIPVAKEYIETQLVPRMPTVILCASMIICSLLSFFCGLLLECQQKRHEQILEILMNSSFRKL